MDVAYSRSEFRDSFYESLFINASWLYEQRLGFFENSEYQWTDLKPFEKRLSKYLESLVKRDNHVEIYCQEHALDGDSGDIFTAVYVLSKRKGLDGLYVLFDDIDFSDKDYRQSLVDAVNLTLSKEDLKTLVSRFFEVNTSDSLEMAFSICAYHQLPFINSILKILQRIILSEQIDQAATLLQKALRTLGKLLSTSSTATKDLNFLFQLFDKTEETDVLMQLAITLFKANHSDILKKCIEDFAQKSWPIVPLGLYGNPNANGALWALLNTGSPEQIHNALLALGLLGNPETIDVCIQCLSFPDYAEASAMTLQLITGADLYEEVFAAEDIDEDTLLPEELERYKKGEPVFPPGEEPGVMVNRLIQDSEPWALWYKDNKNKFSSGQRYRYGHVISGELLLDTLESSQTPHGIRSLIIDELAIQFGINLKIEKTMFVEDQADEIYTVKKAGMSMQ